MLQVVVTWLQRNVRVPLRDTFLDRYVMQPLKKIYCNCLTLMHKPLKKSD